MRKTILAVALCLVAGSCLAQTPAKTIAPKDIWFTPNYLFAVVPDDKQEPVFGVRPNGALILSFSAFLPEIPSQGFHPAEKQAGWLRAYIGDQEVLIPLWLPRYHGM